MTTPEWAGIIHTTAPKFEKGAQDLTMRSRLLLRKIQQEGNLELDQAGFDCSWQVEFKQGQVTQYADGGIIDWSRLDRYRRLTVDWGAYETHDLMTILEKQKNRGDLALINRYEKIKDRLLNDMQTKFPSELFLDGNGSGRENCIDGVETLCGAGTVAATDILAQPSDTYAGLSTALANQGGSWTSALSTYPNSTVATDWPDGQGDTQYDYLSPKLLNWSSSNWGTGLTTWEANAWRVVSQGQTWLTVTGGANAAGKVCLLASNLFEGYKRRTEAKTRIIVPHKESDDLGFGDTLHEDGLTIAADFDVPVNTGYIFNPSKITISSLFPRMWHSKGPDEDPRTLNWLWVVLFAGQVKWQPKHICKLKNYA